MKRRSFLAGLASLVTLGAVKTTGAAVASLSTTGVKEKPKAVKSKSPSDLGLPRPECPYKYDQETTGLGACATNGRLLRMICKFDKSRGKSDYPGRLRVLVAKYPHYFDKMRWYYGLDYSPGWLDRHIKTWSV